MAIAQRGEAVKIGSLVLLILSCISISYYLQSMGYEQVYTHLFYIPIILSCMWWQRKGIGVAVFLGMLVIALGFLLRPDASQINNILRASVFILIAFLVSGISTEEKKGRILLAKEIEKTDSKSREMEEKNRELEKSHADISEKNIELERINKLAVDRELKMIELKKKIDELEKGARQ